MRRDSEETGRLPKALLQKTKNIKQSRKKRELTVLLKVQSETPEGT